MGDKRLNFNRPLISVRRPVGGGSKLDSRRKNESSIPALNPSPSYKSELHSGPLRNPGTVPFVWEQIPGRPKHETKTQKPHVAPNLPPGRVLKHKKEDFDVKTRGLYVENGTMNDCLERSKDAKNGVDGDGDGDGRENEKPQVTYGPNFLQLNDDDSEFDYDEHGNLSFKFCGLLPHFCLKGPIGVLNPTPALSVRARLPISSANRTRVGSSSASSQDAKVAAAYEPKSPVKQQKDPTVEPTEEANQKTSQKTEPNNHSESSPSPPEKEEVSMQKKGLVSFKELLAHENEKEACFENPTVEKTLYVDTVHKVETLEFKENDVDIFGISHEPFGFDLVADSSKHDKEMITKVDQKVNVSSALPAPPPLPKSPSDSWLWRTLPSVNSKTASLWSNHKPSSKTTTKSSKNVQSRRPQGLLLPIPET